MLSSTTVLPAAGQVPGSLLRARRDLHRGQYIKLIYALCTEHKIDLINVGDVKVLGTWAGLCKIDREDNLRKIVGCSCVVVKDYGVESEGLHVLLHYFEKR